MTYPVLRMQKVLDSAIERELLSEKSKLRAS